MKINVIGVPLNLGCDREGVERAPNHLRERGLMKLIRGTGIVLSIWVTYMCLRLARQINSPGETA